MSTESAGVTAEKLAEVARQSNDRPVWMKVGQLIDGLSDAPIRNAHIVFDARQIHFVGTNEQSPDPKHLIEGQRAPDLVLDEYTALPCLIEAHAHLFLEGATIDFAQREQYLKQPAEMMLQRARARWPKLLKWGVGAIRDAGDKHGVGLSLAAEAKAHQDEPTTAPFIDSPGAAIHHRGRYGSFMARPIEEHASIADCVAARVAEGADRIKLLVSGIINFEQGRVITPPQMSADEVSTLVQAAQAHGRQTFAHASGVEGIDNSIEGGVTTIEHGFFITEQQLAKMRDRRIAWVPTFAPVQAQIDHAQQLGWSDHVVGHLKRIIESHQRMLRRSHEMGVLVLAGSDAGSCGVPHGLGLLREMCHMEQAGMPAMAVLRAATGVSAQTLRFAEPVGVIAPNHRARFILTRHDPLKGIANLQKEKIVLFDGNVIQGDEDNTEGL